MTYFIYLGITVILSFCVGMFKGISDAIKDFRTHLGDHGDGYGRKGHPYRDFWHLMDLGKIIGAVILGIFLTLLLIEVIGYNNIWLYLFTIMMGGMKMWFAKWTFDCFYEKKGEKWYNVDEKLKLTTTKFLGEKLGKKVDKWIGWHW